MYLNSLSDVGTILTTAAIENTATNESNVTWSLVGLTVIDDTGTHSETPSDYFAIDSKGNITLTNALPYPPYVFGDYDSWGYTLSVRATFGDSTYSQRNFTVTIAMHDDSLTIADTGDGSNIPENTASGTVVSFAPNGQSTAYPYLIYTYSLEDDAEGRFSIDSITGQVTLNGSLDYETATYHNVIVKVTTEANTRCSSAFIYPERTHYENDERFQPVRWVVGSLKEWTQIVDENPSGSSVVNIGQCKTTYEAAGSDELGPFWVVKTVLNNASTTVSSIGAIRYFEAIVLDQFNVRIEVQYVNGFYSIRFVVEYALKAQQSAYQTGQRSFIGTSTRSFINETVVREDPGYSLCSSFVDLSDTGCECKGHDLNDDRKAGLLNAAASVANFPCSTTPSDLKNFTCIKESASPSLSNTFPTYGDGFSQGTEWS